VSFDEETVLIQILLHADLSSNENILYETFDEEIVFIQILLHTDLSSNENILYETFDEETATHTNFITY
jgi:hypothetical protein